jgi:hypothetical protein
MNMNVSSLVCGVIALVGMAGGGIAWAQSPPVVAGVYTCTDAKGRKLTSDRPIPECTDREQKILNPSGTVKQRVGPTLTAQERAELEKKEKQELEEFTRMADEKRRDRALLNRYSNKAMHEKARAEALAQISVVMQAATQRLTELGRQRSVIDAEMDFYKKDPAKAPAFVRRQLEENEQSQTEQKQFIFEQESEIWRLNVRFDDEATRLRQLWTTIAPGR